MVSAAAWQHVVAIVAAVLALLWLVRRARKGGSKATGPCAACPASRDRHRMSPTPRMRRDSTRVALGRARGPVESVGGERSVHK